MSHQRRHVNPLEFQSLPLEDGTQKVKSNQLELPEGKEDSVLKSTNRVVDQLSSTQESLHIPKKMTWKDKLNTYVQHTQKQNLYRKLEADSTLGGKSLSPYWNEFTKEISDVLSLPIPIEQLDSDSHLLSGYANKQTANSWFSMNVKPLQNKNSLKISCLSSAAFLQGYTGLENINPKSKKQYKSRPRNQTVKITPNAVQKIRIYPSKELNLVWKNWLAAYRWIYNWTIKELRTDKTQSAYSLQSKCRASVRPDWVTNLPGHQLQEAVSDAYDSFKQALKAKGFAKFKSCKANSQVIKFKVGNYKNGTWYSRLTKGLTFKPSVALPTNCNYGTQLVYQKGKWYGCFPIYKEETNTANSKVIALDPGNRSFLTGYDGDTILEVGKKDIGRVNRLCTHLGQLMSEIAKSNSKRQRYKMRKAAQRIRNKIQNLVNDLHKKVSNFLVSNYKVIFLPTFETSKMVMKQKRKLNSKSVRNMLTWAHYRFSQHLTQQANRHNVLVVRCNEAYTSKTCPNCGHIHNSLGGSKTFQCPNCNFTADRDYNGARSIMLRALQATAFIIKDNDIPSLLLLSNN